VLDESSTGLHAKDIEKLSRNINEYDKSKFLEADYISE
jgi:excinuclease UvrABC ATPase subunit